MHIMGITEEESEKITEEIFEEIMTKNFQILTVGIKAHVQETKQISSKKKTRNSTCMLSIFKLQKIKEKERILKEVCGCGWGETLYLRGVRARITLVFSFEAIEARRK